jgi:hypothetical protein
MSSFNDFLKDRRIFDIYDSLSVEQKLEWNKLYQEEKKERAATAPSGNFHTLFMAFSSTSLLCWIDCQLFEHAWLCHLMHDLIPLILFHPHQARLFHPSSFPQLGIFIVLLNIVFFHMTGFL